MRQALAEQHGRPPLSYFTVSSLRTLRGLQIRLDSRSHTEPEANRAFSHGPGQTRLPSLKVAILFEAEFQHWSWPCMEIMPNCGWRSYTGSQSAICKINPPSNPANSALHHYAINFAGVSLNASCELQINKRIT